MHIRGTLHSHDRIRCRIVVRGALGSEWAEWFEGMTITVIEDKDHRTTTILTGELADQAALSGILVQLIDMNLPVMTVDCHPAVVEGGMKGAS